MTDERLLGNSGLGRSAHGVRAVEGDVIFIGVATDISLAGSRIESPEAPGFGAKLTIVASLPGASAPSRPPATVR